MPIDKYAKPERERRFLLEAVPVGLGPGTRIRDRYVRGTRLRVRRMEDEHGLILRLKLGHKIRPSAADPGLILHTSMYLEANEYETLARLPADELSKTRYPVDSPPHAVVDVFAGDLDGLVMMEIDYASEADFRAASPPQSVLKEVTFDEAFTGGALARTTAQELAKLLAGG